MLHVLHGKAIGGCEVLCRTWLRHQPNDPLWVARTEKFDPLDLTRMDNKYVETASLDIRSPIRLVQVSKELRKKVSPHTGAILWHGRRQLVPTIAVLRLAGVRPPYILHIGTSIDRVRLRERIASVMLRLLVTPSDIVIICPTSSVGKSVKKLKALSRYSTCVVPNAVEVPRLGSSGHASPQKTRRLVFVARFDDSKKHDLIVHAVAILDKQHIRPEVLFIGDGPNRCSIEALVNSLKLQEQVKFLGAAANPWSEVGRSDIFVFAVHPREGFGIALAEALLAGLTCLATDIEAMRHLVPDVRHRFPSEDPAALAMLIKEHFESEPHESERMKAHRILLNERLSPIVMIDQYLESVGMPRTSLATSTGKSTWIERPAL